MRRVSWAIVTLALVIAAGWSRTAAGQAPGPPDQNLVAALLVEVRGLRAAMERMASAGPRVQLALGRLQLQEQRVNTMLRRQDELKAQIAEQERTQTQLREQLARTEERARGAVDPADREQAEKGLEWLTGMIEQSSRELQRLRSEEISVAQAVASEQNRWVDINARLEALERELQK